MTGARVSPRLPSPGPTTRRGRILTAVWTAGLACAFVFFVVCGVSRPGFRAAQKHITRQRLRDIDLALARYREAHGRCPPTGEELVAGGYAGPAALKDTWGSRIVYWCSEADVTVQSAGPDKIFDTRDDIMSAPAGVRVQP